MAISRSSRQYLGVRAILPPDLQTATRAPTSSDKAYVKGTLWLDTDASTAYMWPGSSDWIALGSGTTGAIVTLTGDSGGAISPVGGNVSLLGTANQITTTGTAGTITFTLPAAITAPGSLTTTTSLTVGSGFTVTAGTSSLKATTIVGTTSINASGAAVTTIGTGGTGATNIGNATGNTAVTGSLTASTSLTATLGNITATNGNLVLTAAGNKMIRTSVATTTTAGANSTGTVTLVGGTATVSTTAVATGSQIRTWRQSVGATGAAALGQISAGTISNGVSFVINAWQAADATALQASDVSVIGWDIVN